MGILASRTGCSIEASGGVLSRLGWRWGGAGAADCIGIWDRPTTEALSAAERIVADKGRRSQTMTSANGDQHFASCRMDPS
jgi:hypothetical protein